MFGFVNSYYKCTINAILQREDLSLCEKQPIRLSQDWLPRTDWMQKPAKKCGHASLGSGLDLIKLLGAYLGT